MSEIFFRISLTKNVKYRVKSGIYINATRFKDGEIIKPRANQKEIVLLRGIERSLEEIENALLDFFVTVPAQSVSRDMIETIVGRFHNWAATRCKETKNITGSSIRSMTFWQAEIFPKAAQTDTKPFVGLCIVMRCTVRRFVRAITK